jgi:hypothetical protein
VAGLSLFFTNSNTESYWSAITAWIKQLVEIDAKFPALNSAFLSDLEALNITVNKDINVSPTFYHHYQYFTTSSSINGTNETVSNWLIPRSLVQDNLPALVDTIRDITNNNSAAVFVIVGNNVTHENVGNTAASNSVLPAWRDSLFLLNFGVEIASNAPWDSINSHQDEVSSWMEAFRCLTPVGGSYVNEALFNDPYWKSDYFGPNYDRLASVKANHDPEYLLFAHAAVGSDVV